MRTPTVILTALLSLAATTAAATSAGQTPPQSAPVGASNSSEAVRHYETGVKAAKRAQWRAAYDAFLAAWKIKEHFQIAANLGRAELKLRKYRDAAEHLTYFLREAQDVNDAERKVAQAMLDEARAKVGALTILVDHTGAEVRVDGVLIGKAPLVNEVFVEPGNRTVEAKLGGFEDDRKALDISPGTSRTVLLTPVPSAGPRSGLLSPRRAASALGPRVLAAADASESEGPNTGLIGVGVATSAAAVGAGVILTFVSLSKANKRDGLCEPQRTPECDEDHWKSTESDRALTANIAVASFIGAGSVAAATVSYAILGSSSKSKANSAFVVRIHPHGGGGVAVSTTW